MGDSRRDTLIRQLQGWIAAQPHAYGPYEADAGTLSPPATASVDVAHGISDLDTSRAVIAGHLSGTNAYSVGWRVNLTSTDVTVTFRDNRASGSDSQPVLTFDIRVYP